MSKFGGDIFEAFTNFLVINGILASFGEIMPKTYSLKVLLQT